MSEAMHWLETWARDMRHQGNLDALDELRRLIGAATQYGGIDVYVLHRGA